MSSSNEVETGVLRTPDECFKHLPDFPYEPRYIEVDRLPLERLRIHYLDEGPADANPILLMHGEPSWCFLYRKMIPILIASGHRVIAPDLVGFGRSDKLADRRAYSYQFHVDIMNALIGALDLGHITLFCQDWGGLIGIRNLIDHPDRFDRLIPANTGLPTGDLGANEAFKKWLHYSQTVETFHVGGIVKSGCVTSLSDDVIAAYNAPFPSEEYKAGARAFPTLVPISPDDPATEANRRGWEVLKSWPGRVLTLFSDQDPVTARAYKPFQKLTAGAKGQPHTTIAGAGHFLQEDKGEEVAQRIVEWIANY